MKGTKKLFRRVATAVLGLLGFASCDLIGFGLAMYGEPHADFKAVGSVSDESGKPVEGIRVAVRQHRYYANSENVTYDQNHWYDDDTLFTDSKGEYLLERTVFAKPDDVTIVFEDVDGKAHGGEFESARYTPEVVQTKKGDNSWYSGAFEVNTDAVLKKK